MKEYRVSDIILIAGGYHGGWYFDPILEPLRAAGHRVFAPTLPGMEGAAAPGVNFSSHVDAVVDLIDEQCDRDIVLVGQSYGGAVIAAVEGRTRLPVTRMVYLDAVVPSEGDRVWDLVDAAMTDTWVHSTHDGIMVPLPEGFDHYEPRAVPHPLATFLEPIHLAASAGSAPSVYVSAESGPYRAFYDRYLDEPGWECVSLPCGHDVVRDLPEDIARIILAAAAVTV
jgi:pimeloyl-ACP methyl ester carboxylesterase